jgi:acylphosphatase
MTVIRHAIFRGRVQGVGFRVFVEDKAVRKRLEGWVRNRRDGTVEAIFAGAAEAIEAVIETCRKGPPGSRVDAVDQRDGHADELALRGAERDAFAVLPTL